MSESGSRRWWIGIAFLALAPATGKSQTEDPTMPPSQSEISSWRGELKGESTRWRLQSVLISDQRRIAIINGKRVGIDQYVEGARVDEIEPTHVIVETPTERLTLPITRYGTDGGEQQ